MNLGAFHDVIQIQADQRFLQILNHNLLLFLIPLLHPPTRNIRIHNTYPPGDIEEEGVLHLDHIEIHDVTTLRISIETHPSRLEQGAASDDAASPHCGKPEADQGSADHRATL